MNKYDRYLEQHEYHDSVDGDWGLACLILETYTSSGELWGTSTLPIEDYPQLTKVNSATGKPILSAITLHYPDGSEQVVQLRHRDSMNPMDSMDSMNPMYYKPLCLHCGEEIKEEDYDDPVPVLCRPCQEEEDGDQ